MKINIKDVADKAEVSTATVSRVLNDFPGVRKNTKIKVLKAVRELNYEINAIARIEILALRVAQNIVFLKKE